MTRLTFVCRAYRWLTNKTCPITVCSHSAARVPPGGIGALGLSHRACVCPSDAQAALEQERHQLPLWLVAQTAVVAVPKYGRVGRPRQDAHPVEQQWHM